MKEKDLQQVKYIWEIYENLSETVYVSDVKTYELIYMNKITRDKFGINSLEELKGKKCYEVLQGCKEPCAMCTNHLLKEKEFHEWNYYNPKVNRYYSLKDTLISTDNRQFRLEIALDTSEQEIRKQNISDLKYNEKLVFESLSLSLSQTTPEKSINVLIEYIGQALKAERALIFEHVGDRFVSNTYEWCASHAKSHIKELQEVPFSWLDVWYTKFSKGSNCIVEDVETLKDQNSFLYKSLLDHHVKCIVVCPLRWNNEVFGYYGVVNPNSLPVEHIANLLAVLSHFLVSMISRRNLIKKLEKISYYDHLTSLKNRHAMNTLMEKFNLDHSVGLIYADIMGLKFINDTQGHKFGDQLIIEGANLLEKVFHEYEIFRIGGDEFVVICDDVKEDIFYNKLQEFKQANENAKVKFAFGYLWRPNIDTSLEVLISECDNFMYEEKRKFYKTHTNYDRRVNR